MIRFKIDVLNELSNKGFTRTELRRHGLISQATMQNILDRTRLQFWTKEQISENPRLSQMNINDVMMPGFDTINTICLLLEKDIGDVLEITWTDDEIIGKHRLCEEIQKHRGRK